MRQTSSRHGAKFRKGSAFYKCSGLDLDKSRISLLVSATYGGFLSGAVALPITSIASILIWSHGTKLAENMVDTVGPTGS